MLCGLDEDTRSLHQQSKEEMSARAGAESGKAAAHRDPGEIPGRSAVSGRGAHSDPAGIHMYTLRLWCSRVHNDLLISAGLSNHSA